MFEIHDYKVTSKLMTQEEADNDWQLGLYHVALKEKWPDINEVKLVWHSLLFNKDIAIISLTFLIFGDIFSKLFGLAFGRHKIFNKTLEGTLAYCGCVLIVGFILYHSLDIPWAILVIGGITAPLVELFSFNLNDNFTVSLISGTVMTVGTFFGL